MASAFVLFSNTSVAEMISYSRKCSARFQAAKANDKEEFVHENGINHSDKLRDNYHGQKHSGMISGNADEKLSSPFP